MRRPGALARLCIAGLVAALACGALVFHTVQIASTRDDQFYWIDTASAVTLFLDREWPSDREKPPGSELSDAELHRAVATCRRIMKRLAERLPDRHFWRTVPAGAFLRNREELKALPTFQDPGRALLLAWGYARLGGIAPHLLPWLAVIAMLPALCWAMAELWQAGFPWAAATFGGLVGCSPFVVQSLALGHSPFGFYLVALMCVIAFSAYATRSTPSSAGLLVRALAAGAVFAVCVVCRGATLALAAGFLVALVLAGSRLPKPGSRMGRALVVLLGVVLLLTPWALMRRPQHHAVWTSVWEGLGDFDRTKGYVWDDRGAREALEAEGLPSSWVDLSSPETSAFFRARIVGDIKSDPSWYARILAQRFLGTVFLWKLWPRASADGQTFAPKAWPNEGSIDQYYRAVPTVEVVALGQHRWELPVALLVGPSWLLCAAAFAARRQELLAARRTRLRGGLGLLLCVSAAVLTLPILLSTAGALEPQAMGLVYFLGFGLCLDAWRSDQRPSASANASAARS
jgi:hypothetical protein